MPIVAKVPKIVEITLADTASITVYFNAESRFSVCAPPWNKAL